MARRMLADTGLRNYPWGDMMFTAAYLANRAPPSALGIQSPHKIPQGTEADLRPLRVITARASVHIERCMQKLALKAVE